MSREIKFRGWDGRCMYPPEDLSQSTAHRKWLGIFDLELMQYTGLKDKNGVEIYEGDILSEPISPVGGKDGGYRYRSSEVKWLGADRGYSLYAPHAASEVIGNIHEHKHLLENNPK